MRRYLGSAAGWSKDERVMMRRGKGSEADIVALSQYLMREYGGTTTRILRNGRSAIAMALRYGLERTGGEVIINGFTCFAVYQGVREAGFKPVFADIDSTTLNFTIETLEQVLTKKTRAVIVQNTLGNVIDIREIEEFCQAHGLLLIEDLAHCVGRVYPDGRETGTVGNVTVFSFGKEKATDAVTGGAVVFRREPVKLPPLRSLEAPRGAAARRLRWYPTLGQIYRKTAPVGLGRILMRIWLKLGVVQRSADDVVDYARMGMLPVSAKIALERLKNRHESGKKPLREFYLVKEREKVLSRLERAGYDFRGFWYEKPVSPERYYYRVRFDEAACPVATDVARKIVNLPNYYSEAELEPARKIIEEYLDDED